MKPMWLLSCSKLAMGMPLMLEKMRRNRCEGLGLEGKSPAMSGAGWCGDGDEKD